jgi:hypothetical protein
MIIWYSKNEKWTLKNHTPSRLAMAMAMAMALLWAAQ